MASSLSVSSTASSEYEYPHFATQIEELRAQIAQAITAIPASHLARPEAGEIYTKPEDAKARIVDWGFAHGYIIVLKSVNENRGR